LAGHDRLADHLGRQGHGLEMDVNGILYLFAIASGHEYRQGQTGRAAGVEHKTVPFRQATFGHGQPAQIIAGVRIGPGQVDGQISLGQVQRLANALLKGIQVNGIAGVVRQCDIQIAWYLAERKVLSPMNRKGKNSWIMAEDVGRAVPLVNIAIEDDDATKFTLGL
jgi:hypothetical protein